jgi:hypothetical protein
MKLLGMALILVSVSGFALAFNGVPEIHSGSAGTAIALLSGTLLVIRGRRRK